jgi:hypothetical protein
MIQCIPRSLPATNAELQEAGTSFRKHPRLKELVYTVILTTSDYEIAITLLHGDDQHGGGS